MITYLINEKRRRKLKKEGKRIRFVPNYFDSKIETPVVNDGPFATLGGDGPVGESRDERVGIETVHTHNAHSIEVHQLALDDMDTILEGLQKAIGNLPVIFNPGKEHKHMFSMFESHYGNYVILKDAI